TELVGCSQRGLAVARHTDLPAAACQDERQRLQYGGLVLDNQDIGHLSPQTPRRTLPSAPHLTNPLASVIAHGRPSILRAQPASKAKLARKSSPGASGVKSGSRAREGIRSPPAPAADQRKQQRPLARAWLLQVAETEGFEPSMQVLARMLP